jgi:hypothetical protein
MSKHDATDCSDLYLDDTNRTTTWQETVLQRELTPFADSTRETEMNRFPAEMAGCGAGRALVRPPYSRSGPGAAVRP